MLQFQARAHSMIQSTTRHYNKHSMTWVFIISNVITSLLLTLSDLLTFSYATCLQGQRRQKETVFDCSTWQYVAYTLASVLPRLPDFRPEGSIYCTLNVYTHTKIIDRSHAVMSLVEISIALSVGGALLAFYLIYRQAFFHNSLLDAECSIAEGCVACNRPPPPHAHTYRLCYAPYQLFKKCGIKGPTPSVFTGNYNVLKNKVFTYTYMHQHHWIYYFSICARH